jgi:agmatine/peptidylarginine deiminase
MTWRMPLESAQQDRTWMAFPRVGPTLGDDLASAEDARRTWASVANTISEHQPVTVVVDPSARDDAARHLSSSVDTIEAELDDFWMRDIGPTFVTDPSRPGELGAVDWVFNGWGANAWATWTRDDRIAATIAEASGATHVPSTMVNEGGGIHTDGNGLLLATETVQRDPRRNPYLSRERIEAEFARTIGTDRTIWLPRGLTRDNEDLGTRGHVDMVATFASPDVLLVHAQPDAAHPDHLVMPLIRAALDAGLAAAGVSQNGVSQTGASPTVIELPAPSVLTDDEGYVDWNYVNHVPVNGAVIACSFGDDAADDRARGILADAYPGRQVVSIDAREVFARGGGLHCITQNQPSV